MDSFLPPLFFDVGLVHSTEFPTKNRSSVPESEEKNIKDTLLVKAFEWCNRVSLQNPSAWKIHYATVDAALKYLFRAEVLNDDELGVETYGVVLTSVSANTHTKDSGQSSKSSVMLHSRIDLSLDCRH